MQIPVETIPAEVTIETTGFEERQSQLREIDRQRKIEDPSFKGAFHTKKRWQEKVKKSVQSKQTGKRR
jgi:ATP-dependent RNA helicase RhlE